MEALKRLEDLLVIFGEMPILSFTRTVHSDWVTARPDLNNRSVIRLLAFEEFGAVVISRQGS